MKKTPLRYIFTFMALILGLISACKDDNQTLFSSRVANDRGSLKVVDSSSYLGSTVPGTSFDQPITVYSAGGLKLTDFSATLTTSAPITWAGGAYPGTGGTCTSELESGQSCTVVVHYQPTVVASHSATLDFYFNDALGAGTLQYIVYADSHPILQFEYGSSYDFGNRFLNTTTDLRIRVTNVGKVPAESVSINNLTAPFSYKGGTYPGTGGDCGTRVPVNSTCTLYITYAPVNKGQHSQDITFNYLNSGRSESNTLSLLAWGFEEAVLSLSNASGLTWGTVVNNYDFPQQLTVTYVSGDVDATGLSISGMSAPFSQIAGGTCLTSLSKTTGSCTIKLKLNSVSSGTWSQNLIFSYNSGLQTRTIQRSLQAITKQKAALSFFPTGTVDFGLVGNNSNSDQTFTITYASGEIAAQLNGFTTLSAPFNYVGGSYPGTGGTCGSSLSSGSCTVRVRYSPTTLGSHQLSLPFAYTDGNLALNSSNFILNGKTESQLGWGSAPPFAFGDVVVGQSKTLNYTITTTGGATSSLTSTPSLTAPFSFYNSGAYPGTGGTCTNSFTSASCTFRITFTPTAVGAAAPQNLTINYNDGLVNRTLTASLTGTGKSPATLVMADTDFGNVAVGSYAIKTITITNTSTMTASAISRYSLPTGFTYRTTGSTCGTTLAGGANCVMAFVFTPTTAKYYDPQPIVIKYDDGTGGGIANASLTANFSGTGQFTSGLYLSEFDTYSFGNIYLGQPAATLTMTLTHGGSATPAVINSKTMSLPADYTIDNDTCPSSLVNGQSCTFRVNFTPSLAAVRSNTLTVAYNDGNSQTVTRAFTGTGVNPTVLTISASNLNFGTLPTDTFADQTITVTRTGSGTSTSVSLALTGTGFTYAGTGAFPGGGTCVQSAITNGCTIKLRFSPTSDISYSGKFEITYNNGYGSAKASTTLSGTGAPTAVLTFASSSTNFGSTIQSTTVSRTITVNRTGPINATSISPSGLSAPYAFKGGSFPGTGGTCSTTLSDASCTIVVDFSPTSVGTQTKTLNLTYNNGTASRTISATLTGTAVTQAIITKTPNAPYSFGSSPIGTGVDKTITLSNAGATTATNLAATFNLPVFSFKNGSFPGTGGTCGTQITSNSSCTIVLQFKPTAATPYSGLMTFTYDDGLRTQTELLDLTGN